LESEARVPGLFCGVVCMILYLTTGTDVQYQTAAAAIKHAVWSLYITREFSYDCGCLTNTVIIA